MAAVYKMKCCTVIYHKVECTLKLKTIDQCSKPFIESRHISCFAVRVPPGVVDVVTVSVAVNHSCQQQVPL